MSMFRVLHLRHFHRQPVRTLLAALGISAAVATTVVAVSVVTSLDRSTTEILSALGGPAPLRVVGPLTRGGVAPDVLPVVASIPGVEAAVPAVHAVVVAESAGGDGASVMALGVDCRVEALFGSFGCDDSAIDPTADGPALISASLASQIGTDGVIRTDAGRVPIGEAVRNDSLDDMNGGRIVVFSLPASQRLFDRGDNVDAVYVVPESGVEVERLRSRIEAAIGDHNMVLLRDEPASWLATRGPLLPLLALACSFAIGLSVLLVYNGLALSLAERRRDIAVTSAVGATPRSVARNLLAEAAVLGAIGSIGGIVAGIVLSRAVIRSFASVVTEQASGMRVNVHLSWSVVLIGLVVGIVAAVAAAYVPVRRATRLDLAAELHGRGTLQENAPHRRRMRLVLLLAGVGGTLAVSHLAQRGGALEKWQPTAGGLALMTSGFFVFAAAGALTPLVLGVVLRAARGRGGPTRIAIANVITQGRRSSVIAATVASAVGVGVVIGSLIPAIRDTVSSADGEATDGRVYVTTLPLNNASNIDARLSRKAIAKLEKIDGVAAVDETHCAETSDELGAYSVCGLEGATRIEFPLVMGDPGIEVLARGEAMIGTGLARVRGLRPGSVLKVATATGFRDVRVGGIWTYSRDNGHSATVPLALQQALFGTGTPHVALVRPEPGVTPEELARRIDAAKIDPDLYTLTPGEVTRRMAEEVALQVTPFWVMQRTLLFVVLVATLSTLLIVGVQRRRELGILGAVGFSPGGLGRLTVTEALVAGGAGALLGTIGAGAVFETLRNAAAVSVGARPPFTLDPMSAVVAIALGLAVVTVGSLLPAWRTSRLQIVEAIRDE
jgi:putative ABC transport system permease protein